MTTSNDYNLTVDRIKEQLLNSTDEEIKELLPNLTNERIKELLPILTDDEMEGLLLNLTDERIKGLLPILTDDEIGRLLLNLTDERIKELLLVLTVNRIKRLLPHLTDDEMAGLFPNLTNERIKELLPILTDDEIGRLLLNLTVDKIEGLLPILTDGEIKKLFNLTEDKIRLLYIIRKYYQDRDPEKEKLMWAKEITILVALFQILASDLSLKHKIYRIEPGKESKSEKQQEIEDNKKKIIFQSYRFAPTYRQYQGNRRLMNICVDALEDISDMIKRHLLKKFKIATATFTFENSVKLTLLGSKVFKIFAPDTDSVKAWEDEIDSRLSCSKCGEPADIVLSEDQIGFLCKKNKKHFDLSLIFYIQEIEYDAEPFSPFERKKK